MTTASADLRQQQTQLTRDLIMDALVDLILDRGLQDFSVQQVADEAGVSHRTVYRHYPNRQALLDALAQWLSERFEQRMGRSEDTLYDDPAANVAESFSLMDEVARHARAYVILTMGMATPAAGRKKRTDRLRRAVEKGPARSLPRPDARAVSALVRCMMSSSTWFQLTQELGLDGVTAGRVTSWAVQTLFDELEAGGGPATKK